MVDVYSDTLYMVDVYISDPSSLCIYSTFLGLIIQRNFIPQFWFHGIRVVSLCYSKVAECSHRASSRVTSPIAVPSRRAAPIAAAQIADVPNSSALLSSVLIRAYSRCRSATPLLPADLVDTI